MSYIFKKFKDGNQHFLDDIHWFTHRQQVQTIEKLKK